MKEPTTNNIVEIKMSDRINSLDLCGSHYKGIHLYDLTEIAPAQKNFYPNFPLRINSLMLMICKQGKASVRVNLEDYTIRNNTIFINKPNNLLNFEQKESDAHLTDGVIIVLDEEQSKDIHFDIKDILPLALRLKDNSIIQLPEEDCDLLLQMLRNISREIRLPEEEPFHQEVLKNYFELFFFKMGNVISKALNIQPAGKESSAKSRNEEYFHRFIRLLGENYKQERSLGFYASQLCITPKYLTSLIKRVSGRSAAEWIDQYVVLEAKNLLRYSSKSIQEVAYELNFPNQSFFGKYFKHQTGYSPSAYKLLKQ